MNLFNAHFNMGELCNRSKFEADTVKSSYNADYAKDINGELEREITACNRDPIALLNIWLEMAKESGKFEDPHAMQVATVNKDGQPGLRTVLLRLANNDGIAFCTDLRSRKAKDLSENPKVACVLFWDQLQRQVRIEGTAARNDTFQDQHFASRKRESKIVATVCTQSAKIESREKLVELFNEGVAASAENEDIERPSHWVGYLITVRQIEFWRGHKSRLNERIVFEKEEAGNRWTETILQPH